MCPNCFEENPDKAKFCLNCGSSLGSGVASEERKVVTIVFADLVGFTRQSDHADPEDVKAMLRPFHARLKREIERFGGTVDKFIGDAVLGVFGAPVIHEDDPERAIHAALAIQAAMVDLDRDFDAGDLHARIGVETGEAVVAFGAGPLIGEALAGDVVNTASRLQSVAPPGGIAVGESAFRATRSRFDFEALEPVTVKGKTDPLSIWLARGALVATAAEPYRVATAPFVGREEELAIVRSAYARAVREREPQLVTVVGEPGIGKSRLMRELRARLESGDPPPVWLRGRCLSY
jgi:class 3 adenylate cyclase